MIGANDMSPETLNTIVGQLVAAGVHEPQGAGDFLGDDRPVTLHDHPRRGLWLGLTVDCPEQWFAAKISGLPFYRDALGGRAEPTEKHPKHCECEGARRVARDISQASPGMVEGLVSEVCEAQGWRLENRSGRWKIGEYGHIAVLGEADTPLLSLGAAVTKVLGGAG